MPNGGILSILNRFHPSFGIFPLSGMVRVQERPVFDFTCDCPAAEPNPLATVGALCIRGYTIMNVSEAITKRKSVRAYLDKPVLAEDLAKIVEAGQWAPNAGAFQISVIRNAGLRQRINDLTHSAMVNSGVEFLLIISDFGEVSGTHPKKPKRTSFATSCCDI
ncbi:nitroreductase family protein [Desulfosarcina ovata]|uniref:Nitroreductase domain-containing protein n=1 Tax=Desulfosarcina ovata subsp. ovata TaxID=2752305 RepID=A0A5K8AHL0_9BACT|nr:hypothetical protein DSCOOX_45300 [Desulfosarcina ovata subsp. ovata]